MLVMRASLLLFALLILVGCVGPRVPVKKIDELPLEERHAVLGLPIYNESQLAGKEYTVINLVEGISCKNKTWDPAATKTDAINQAKYWAREQGAQGVMNYNVIFLAGQPLPTTVGKALRALGKLLSSTLSSRSC